MMNDLSGKRFLVTGGAGFVGSNLAIAFRKRYPGADIIALDNLKRRGSELNIARLKEHQIEFVHGDIRNPEDLEFGDRKIDVILECSAEPSVLAGFGGSPGYLLNSNLTGAINCLELARKQQADFVFLSTSRVYPVESINNLAFEETESRFSLAQHQSIPGASVEGISEAFPLAGVRSLYGATKLAAELIAMEYSSMYGVRTIIDRCGVLAGPWQMGKVDQGVFTLWMAAHIFNKPLRYIGFGGSGKQVRDVLHVDDLFELLDIQLRHIDKYDNRIFNVGGGREFSLSLQETTRICEKISANKINIKPDPEPRPADLTSYISDSRKIIEESGWKPKHTPQTVLQDIHDWITENKTLLKPILS